MQQFFADNKYFFLGFVLYLLIGGIILFNIEQGDAIRYFSDRRSSLGDTFFTYFTKMGELFMYLLAMAAYLFYRFRFTILIIVLGLVNLVVSFTTKAIFLHDRPSRFFRKIGEFDQLNLIDGVHLLSGTTSFPSGHTISGFALYGLLSFILPKKWWLGILLFITAALIAISRIYLVQHFLKDVYAGAIVGTFVAVFIYYLQSRIPYDPTRVIDQSLLNRSKSRKPQA